MEFTLNEVIEHFEKCISHDGDCSKCMVEKYCNCFPWRDFDREALKYLKEYQDLKEGKKWNH